ncbi:S24 family peptidase [Pseudomonas sp. JS3066]|uniref:LexA family transcriptional regulator n=1 Tax=Pseudomonas sp. JS3066 TaxID=3090665 RepID=UPI002E7BAB4F|nr:S24 family peptidase [Pseudomonas sp. JS3066]WVK91163.1 S24 family peptidase [Pseudomonas sp. JS3066]
MQKNSIQTILPQLLKREGITPTELSRITGVGQSTISRMLSGKIANPKDEQVYPIAEHFHISTDQLRGRYPIDNLITLSAEENSRAHRQGAPMAPEAVMDGPMEVWDDDTPLPEDEVLVPFLKEVELAAGSGRMSVEVNTKRRLRFGKYSLKNKGVDPANARCVTITGNSMEPVLKNGATVGVDVGNTRIVDGDLFAIDHGGQLRVKQAYRLPGGGIRLRSFNRDEHPDEEYSLDDMARHEIVVIGRVFWGAMYF